MNATDNNAEWIHIGNIRFLSFVANDVLIYGSGCFLKLYNIVTGEQHVLFANRHCDNGDGIRAVRGHRSVNTFAYAESSRESILYVKEYPTLKTIVTFKDGPPEGYTNVAFSETSLLIALGTIPNFVITIWNWRKKEKLGELKSNIKLENQMLRVSWGKPVSMVQLGTGSDKLFLWDIFVCCRTAVLAKHDLKFHKAQFTLAQFSDCTWTTEGKLYVVDLNGCLYSMNAELELEKEIDVDIDGDIPTTISRYKNGIAISGPNKEVRHYVKNGSWECQSTITLESGIKRMFCNKSDYLVGVTMDERLVRLSEKNVTTIKQNKYMIIDFCIIYPTGRYIVVLRQHKFLDVYNTSDGKEISTLELNGKALTLAENPELPYIVIGYDDGILELISVYKPQELSVMTSFHLSRNSMDNVKFFENGRLMVAGCSDVGEFFIIEGLPGTQMRVITCVEVHQQIVDFMLVASKNCYRLFLIPTTTFVYLAGNKIIRYCIVAKGKVNIKEYYLENKEFLYRRLIPTRTSTRDRIFYALPFNSRNIHILETKRGDPLVRIISEIQTGHQMRNIGLHITKNYAVTWGYDGFIIARDNNFEKDVGMALPHHRYHGGVKKAYIDPLGKYIISLGREANLVCTNIAANEIDEERRKYLIEQKDSAKFAVMFKKSTYGFIPEGRFQNKTWLEVEKILHTEREAEICRIEKENILQKFANIKNELMNLVTKNLEGPENEQIDLQEFYLDTGLCNQKKKHYRNECRHTEMYLKALMVAQDKVRQHLMDNYWNKMKVMGKVVTGLFINTAVARYTMLPDDIQKKIRLDWYEEQRKLEKFFTYKGSFMSWRILREEDVLESVQRPVLPKEDYDNIHVTTLMDTLDTSQSSEETQQAMAGTVTAKYVDANPSHYYQGQITTFYQCDIIQYIAEFELVKLKKHFNELFDDLVKQKSRDIDYVIERNTRLRHILSEINYFSTDKIDLEIPDPEWKQTEQPELITKVTDEEMSVTPYISPSHQAILDARAAEEERIRLALLADDFKDRALMTMMNGVLEVRWEDELRRDVPIPKCMIEKEPENFSEEDLHAIKDYEEKVAHLDSERERYKNLLRIEFTKISTHVRDVVRKFNAKVADCLTYKINVDSAGNQENLKVNRNRYRQNLRVQLMDQQEEIDRSFEATELALEDLRYTISSLSEGLNECRTDLDVYQLKEKILEKAFKKDIQEMTPLIQEQAIKIYKKRPKIVFRHVTTASIYAELARCVVNNEKSLLLTEEGLDFLSTLDALEKYTGVPPIIDEYTHNIICKHRRLRLEFEIRMKGFQTQVADGEATIATYQDRLTLNKERCVRLQAELEKVNRDYAYLMHNLEVQIVLRRGLVEIPLTGSLTDFTDAILIPRKEIEDINKLIKEAGNNKINAIMRNTALRRNIMIREWEHQRIRMSINDLIEHISDIENVKFTKEMQQFLSAKAKGRKVDHESVDYELERIALTCQQRIKVKRKRFSNITKQIQTYKDHNYALDTAIKNINIDICDLHLQKDDQLNKIESKVLRLRMDALLKRSSLINQIQHNHNEILILQTELELLRLKTYPTFKYKLIHT